jgi:hypothetical protein
MEEDTIGAPEAELDGDGRTGLGATGGSTTAL